MNYSRLAIVAVLLSAITSPCLSREIQVLTFRFEIPDSWRFEGGGRDYGKFFATGARSEEMGAPPYVLVEACTPTKSQNCNDLGASLPPKEIESLGCGIAEKQVLAPRAGVDEVRWICQTVKFANVPLTAGISIFRHQGSVLYVAYASDLGPRQVGAFLKSLSQSLTISQSDPTPR